MEDSNNTNREIHYSKKCINQYLQIGLASLSVLWVFVAASLIMHKQITPVYLIISIVCVINLYQIFIFISKFVNQVYITVFERKILISNIGIFKKATTEIDLSGIDKLRIEKGFFNNQIITFYYYTKKVTISEFFLEKKDYDYLEELLTEKSK